MTTATTTPMMTAVSAVAAGAVGGAGEGMGRDTLLQVISQEGATLQHYLI